MKRASLIFAMIASSSLAYAQDHAMCRAQLLDLAGIDASQTKINVTKHLVGTVTSINFDDFRKKLVEGGPCTLNLTIYQVDSAGASVSVEDSFSEFNPFNHSVGADDSSESCVGSNANAVSGSSFFIQDAGWHHSFGTSTKLSKNFDGTFTLEYQTSEGGLLEPTINKAITCTGALN